MVKNKGRYGYLIKWIFTFIDFVVLNVTFVAVCQLARCHSLLTHLPLLALNFSFLLVLYVMDSIHSHRTVYLDQALGKMLRLIVAHAATFITALALMEVPFGWKNMAWFYLAFAFTLGLWWITSRKLIKAYRSKGYNYRRIIVIGGGAVGVRLMNELESDLGYGYRLMGFFDDNRKNRSVKGYKGGLNEIEPFLKDNVIDEMYCAIPDNNSVSVKRLINIAENNAIDFYYVPQLNRDVTRRFVLDNVGTVPILSIHSYPLSNPLNRLVKRTFDVVVSSVLLLISPVVFIPVAIGVKLSSPGPVLFRQKRTGYRGQSFTCYKFRTMWQNASSDTRQATSDDPRTTRFGRFLRRTSIDELPQFINVWRGEMSIVGPRPHMVNHTEVYSQLIDKYMLRHTIKPGITGWAQVNGYRGVTDELWKMEKRVEFDVWYTENWTFLLDMKIIFLTIAKMFNGDDNAV